MSITSDRVKNWRKKTKTAMVQAMGGKCQCCGYDKECSLTFHHLDPSKKDFTIGSIRANPTSWNRIIKELDKCVLVCHNCHGEIHHENKQLPENYATFDINYLKIYKEAAKDNCPICDKLKPVSYIYCSRICSGKSTRKVDWDNIDVIQMLNEHGIIKLSKMLNISDKAIYKRRDKVLKEMITIELPG